MTDKPDLLCMEDTGHGVSRWFRIAQMNQQLYVIESTSYAATNHAYLMQFADQAEFDRWIDQQQQQGWQITYTNEHNFKSFDPEIVAQAQTNIFQVLRAKR